MILRWNIGKILKKNEDFLLIKRILILYLQLFLMRRNITLMEIEQYEFLMDDNEHHVLYNEI
jgi:hypothetical protein